MKRLILNLTFAILLPIITFAGVTIHTLPHADSEADRTLVLALDGVDHDLMAELYKEGYFKNFESPRVLVSTFPSATTIGFTGIFQPFNAGQTPGYEIRFYSYDENKIMGGTPGSIKKIPINYKYYFDSFRRSIFDKGIMYSFPSMASQQDMLHAKKLALESPKNVILAYMGGTDGSAHMLGRKRTKRTLKELSRFLVDLQKKHEDKFNKPLRVVLLSDHGFYYNDLKTVTTGDIKKKLKSTSLKITTSLKNKNDVVIPEFGLISAGAVYTHVDNRKTVAEALTKTDGIDVVLWHTQDPNFIFIQNKKGIAKLEYKNGDRKLMRYVPISGDPIHYQKLYTQSDNVKWSPSPWWSEKEWLEKTYNMDYPDVLYRAHDAFFGLVKNQASLIFSVDKDYQFGSLPAEIGTLTRGGQHGTHGSLIRETSQAFYMATPSTHYPTSPEVMRYNQALTHALPSVAKAYEDLPLVLPPHHDKGKNHEESHHEETYDDTVYGRNYILSDDFNAISDAVLKP